MTDAAHRFDDILRTCKSVDLTKLDAAKVALCIYPGALQKAWKPTLVGSRAPTDLVLLQPSNRERENHVATHREFYRFWTVEDGDSARNERT